MSNVVLHTLRNKRRRTSYSTKPKVFLKDAGNDVTTCKESPLPRNELIEGDSWIEHVDYEAIEAQLCNSQYVPNSPVLFDSQTDELFQNFQIDDLGNESYNASKQSASCVSPSTSDSSTTPKREESSSTCNQPTSTSTQACTFTQLGGSQPLSLLSSGDCVFKQLIIENVQNNGVSSFEPVSRDLQTVQCSSADHEPLVDIDFEGEFYGLPNYVRRLVREYKGISDLYDWQDECLRLPAVGNRQNLIYSLPTSGGKTLVAEILMLKEIVCRKKDALFVLPYISLVQEKVRALSPFAVDLKFSVEEYAGGKGSFPPKLKRNRHCIYVATIEKAHGLITNLIEVNRLDELGLVVVDELHMLGEGNHRGAALENALSKLIFVPNDVQIIGMSATLGNILDLKNFLNAEMFVKDFRPVELKEYIKVNNNILQLNFSETGSRLKMSRTCNFEFYTKEMQLFDSDSLSGLVQEVVPDNSCLVFCPSRKNCENVALLICKGMPRNLKFHKLQEKQALLRALSADNKIPVCEVLRKTVLYGVAYHHGGLTMDERTLIEEGYTNGTLSCLTCTSTLAAGVNLPAKRVILRSPYMGKEFLSRSRYKQMIGRAGRAGIDSSGESILIMKPIERSKVMELLIQPEDECLSSLMSDELKGVKSLILSVVGLEIVNSVDELDRFLELTLLNIQKGRLEVDMKNTRREAVRNLVARKLLKLYQHPQESQSNRLIPTGAGSSYPVSGGARLSSPVSSQVSRVVVASNPVSGSGRLCSPLSKVGRSSNPVSGDFESPDTTNDRDDESGTFLKVTDLGKATFKASISVDVSAQLYKDLAVGLQNMVLTSYFHLLYLVTPYDTAIRPQNNIYHDMYHKLNHGERQVARVIGVLESQVTLMLLGRFVKNLNMDVWNRFYSTLILYQLWKQRSVWEVADEFQVDRGTVQNLLNSAVSFASCVVHFCTEFPEFWPYQALMEKFMQQLSYCVNKELIPLMELPAVKKGRAMQLYNAGFRSVKDIAHARPDDLVASVPHLPRRTAVQIVAAAKMLVVEKSKELREEAEDLLVGLDVATTITNQTT